MEFTKRKLCSPVLKSSREGKQMSHSKGRSFGARDLNEAIQELPPINHKIKSTSKPERVLKPSLSSSKFEADRKRSPTVALKFPKKNHSILSPPPANL
jgi:hypothetical protein